MDRIYTIHTREKGILHLKESEIIANAKEQESKGIKPSYSFYGRDFDDIITPAGWLIWSTWEDGCGVCYKTANGNYGIVTGWQGEFVFS